ncbi:hypothetical protein NXW44_12905 [Phocaeicola vulgatus]|uniref:hypothetical protein n=1 Tax=Phocaeicola vulgatus TaxID=821 RepID=UPI0021650CD6|nr:hypothetical protein [Phocaeicola vulgatus]MCS2315098.1 hypothetical protein [Phocaeicola vulgatus]MDU6665966.1 hypothetical protein [Bacteroides sp.]
MLPYRSLPTFVSDDVALATRDRGSIRIRSITERHSLFPLSYTRTPCRLTLRFAYPLRWERYGLTVFYISDK